MERTIIFCLFRFLIEQNCFTKAIQQQKYLTENSIVVLILFH